MDIKTLGDLLSQFVSAEAELLNQKNIRHPTTIGAMYEGLTAEVLNKIIFDGLNLRVVKNSFIRNSSQEFDVLLVEGDGEEIPRTGRYIYEIEQVIAIVEVRKNLYSKDIVDGYKSLQFIIDLVDSTNVSSRIIKLLRMAFKAICRKDISSIDKGRLTEQESFVYSSLCVEASLPLRIVWGYNGFSSEYKFRESYNEFLKANVSVDTNNMIPGFAPHNFPNLVICGKYVMTKLNGMPFGTALHNGWWRFFSSSANSSTHHFLELIWTRLANRYQISSDIFGDDLLNDVHNKFLDCRIGLRNGKYGWEYNYTHLSKKYLCQPKRIVEWEPTEINDVQFIILNELCANEEIDINDQNFQKFVTKNNIYNSLDNFLESLVVTGLVFVEDGKLRLLTDQLQIVILPNGKTVAAENNTGRLTRWINRLAAS